MKHSICGFNHAALCIDFKLDYTDAIIIRCIVDFRETGKMKSASFDGKNYFWISYTWLLEELIGLRCSKRALAERMKKICDSGLMEFMLDKEDGNRTYYRFNESNYEKLVTYPIGGYAANTGGYAGKTAKVCGLNNIPYAGKTAYIDPSYNNPSTRTRKEEAPLQPHKPEEPSSLTEKKNTSQIEVVDSSSEGDKCSENSGPPKTDHVPDQFEKLAMELRGYIRESGTDMVFRSQHLVEWQKTFRLMIDRDKRTIEAVRAKMKAVFEDSFWSKQIRSADKLRKQWNGGMLDKLIASEIVENSDLSEKTKKYPSLNVIHTRFINGLKKNNPGNWQDIDYVPDITSDNSDVWFKVFDIMTECNLKDGISKILHLFSDFRAKNDSRSESEY